MKDRQSERMLKLLQATDEVLQVVDRALAGNASKGIDDGPLFISITDAGRMCGLSRTSIWRLIRDGVLKPVVIGAGMRRLRRADVLALAAKKEVA